MTVDQIAERIAAAYEDAADELIAGRLAEQRHQVQDPAVPAEAIRSQS